MKQVMLMALPLAFMVACTQDVKSSEQMTLQAQKERAMIERGVQSLRIASFYIADPQDASTNEATVPTETMAVFAKKSRLYQGGALVKQSASLASQQYKSFIQANAANPHVRQFRRETAEKFLTENQALSATDKAYFTNELIINRSSNLALISSSLLSLRGNISAAEHAIMRLEAQRLMDQYETHYKRELANTKERPEQTYRQRAMKALDSRFAELVLTMVDENRRLLATAN
ncbi:hypothetical protein A6C57_10920 [Fibrella sp. ES10-3-2-2]|nr:hypothetical protein A6C57_10920 [Fibrella sp. ES10-3-2-2]